MSDLRDPRRFSEPWQLKDGTPVLIRAIRGDDRGKIVAAFHELDPESVYTRFFSYRKELSDADLGRLDGADFVNAVVLVVTLGSAADEVLIGGVSYYTRAERDGSRVAEVAFTIEEDYQGKGLASKLLALAAGLARDQGVSRFEAEVLPGNAAMLAVFQHSGLALTQSRDEDVIHVVLQLGEGGAAQAG